MARGRDGGRLPVTDLTNGHFHKLTGQPVVDIAKATLEAGSSLVDAWRRLEPIVRSLTAKVQVMADGELTGPEAAKLLGMAANVVQKVGAASQGMLRASDGMQRLALLLDGGVQRVSPKALTEKQLASLVLETARQIAKDRGACPICADTPVDVTPPPAEETVQ